MTTKSALGAIMSAAATMANNAFFRFAPLTPF